MKKKYKLVKNIIIASLVSGSIILFTPEAKASNISSDISPSNEEFHNEIEYLNNLDSITFQNVELFNIVSSKVDNLNTNSIKDIKTLVIDQPLSNNDLSDLKYLTNLKFLIIKNNTIDLSDLKYNQELNSLELSNCNIYNSEYLPNSLSCLYIINSQIPLGTLTTPYNLENLILHQSPISKLDLKNPSNLKDLYLVGNSYISLLDIEECLNLKNLNILHCSSIKDPYVLSSLPSLKNLELDEYASIWLNQDILNTLPVSKSTKDSISNSLIIIDNIYNMLNDSSLSDEDKIKSITSYIISNYYYNEEVSNSEDIDNEIALSYNEKPITSLSREDGIICVNYACLFQALANRFGLESYEISNDIHAWNCVNLDNDLYYYDLTFLDSYNNVEVLNSLNSSDNLPYYHFTSLSDESSYSNTQTPIIDYSISNEIGYYNIDSLSIDDFIFNKNTFPFYHNLVDNKEFVTKKIIQIIILSTLLLGIALKPKKLIKK